MSSLLSRTIALLACAVALVAPASAAPASSTVTLRTEDGVSITGTYYQAARQPAPIVILVHMLTRSRGDWEPLATRLAESGISALAIDLRGHGASGAPLDGKRDVQQMVLDVRAARLFAKSRPDVMPERIGVAGASIGASLAILTAVEDPAVRSLALLSPSLDYRGLHVEAPMRTYGDRPALIVASLEDPYATRSARDLATIGAARELRLLEGAGHGTVMLSREPDLVRVVVDWFERTLL